MGVSIVFIGILKWFLKGNLFLTKSKMLFDRIEKALCEMPSSACSRATQLNACLFFQVILLRFSCFVLVVDP